jgi:hypothetical protein
MAALPSYYSEVAPPHSRGLMAGAHGSFINMGYALAGWVGYVHTISKNDFKKQRYELEQH